MRYAIACRYTLREINFAIEDQAPVGRCSAEMLSRRFSRGFCICILTSGADAKTSYFSKIGRHYALRNAGF